MNTIAHYMGTLSRSKKIAVVLISCMLIMSCIGGTYAAYISRSFVKSVAASPKQVLNMSSDYLGAVSRFAQEADFPTRKVLIENDPDSNVPYTLTFYIENTSAGNVSTKPITYDLLVSGSGLTEGFKIYYQSADITAAASTGFRADTLPANTKTTHYYQVEIPTDPDVIARSELIIRAIPTSDSDSSGNILAARIQPGSIGTIAAFSYSGSFSDKTADNHPYDFAAFNYEVMVSGARGDHTMLLTWDNTKLEIDPAMNKPNSGSLELIMNSENNHFIIKFYRLVGRNAEDSWQSDWNQMNSIVSFAEK